MHVCLHGIRKDVDLALRSRSAREAGKVEREVRGVLVGGLYSEVGRNGRVRIPDVSSTRQRKVLDMKHDLDGINSLPEAST